MMGSVALYLLLALTISEWISPLWLVVAVPLVYTRTSLGLHELLHLRSAASLSFYFRLCMILDTPWGLGYREHRHIHLRHHRWNAGASDPELFQIDADPWRAMARAMVTPEYQLWQWIRQRGVASTLTRDAGVRLSVFLAVASTHPAVFLVYWLTLRVCIGVSGFVFHHVLHRRSGQLGTFALEVSPFIQRLAAALFGSEPILILMRHRAHHLWPQLRVTELPDLPPHFVLPPGALRPEVRRDARTALQQKESP